MEDVQQIYIGLRFKYRYFIYMLPFYYFYLSYVYHIIKHDCFFESVLIVINLNA